MRSAIAVLLSFGLGLSGLIVPHTIELRANESTVPPTEVILLGTGTPYPDPASSGPATAVVIGGRLDVELGRLAIRIQPRLLVLDHIVRMGATDEELLSGVRAGGYTGQVIIGKDLARY
jgi:hypothetical protein